MFSFILVQQVLTINTVPGDLVRDGTLVRLRGMVQDQFDPEFYLKQFTVVNRDSGEKACPIAREYEQYIIVFFLYCFSGH